MSEKYKSICIKSTTYNELVKEGNLQDTFDTVITRLIETSKNSTDTKVNGATNG